MVNGVTKLIMMKSDVLDTFDTIKACVAYRIDGKDTADMPFDLNGQEITPVYVELPGWKTDLSKCTGEASLPNAFTDYISFLEKELDTPISILSVGPDRTQTIVREKARLR